MHHHTTTTCEVLVVGAGPAGLTAAAALARQGIDVLLVERHHGTSPFPKATGISTRSMELFRTWGIERMIRAGAMQVRPVMTVSQTITAGEMFSIPFGYPTDEAALGVSPCTPCYCPQDHLELVLLQHLLERGGRVRFGVELAALTNGSTGFDVELLERGTARMERVRCRYLIGADGPRSTVRSAVGIGLDDLGTIGDFVAVTFRAELTHRFASQPAAINSVEIAGAEGVFVPTGANDRWVYAREWHPESGDSIAAWTEEKCTALIRWGAGVPGLDVDILGVMPFVMGGHLAQAFRCGRTFLVGDAAHRTTPVGGTGMNTAIHAAHNLGWKLAWVLRGWANDSQLDSYEEERRPIGTANVLMSLRRGPGPDAESADGLARDIGVRYTSAVIDAALDAPVVETAEFDGRPDPARLPAAAASTSPAAALSGADQPAEIAVTAVAGQRAPHAWVRYQGMLVSTLDLFDGRLTVLTGRRGHLHGEVAELAAQGLPVVMLTVDRDLLDENGDLEALYGSADGHAVLVRPDGYVAWRGSASAADAAECLRSAVDLSLGWCGSPALRRAG